MAKARRKTLKKSSAKKKWVPILAPKLFNNQQIGETHVYDIREAIGKPLTVNLMTLTKNPKAQGTNVSFLITGQHDGKLTTEFTGFKVMTSVVRRMVRRGKNKIEDSFICLTSDGKKIRMKPIVITKTKAKGSVLTRLRKALRQHLVNTAAKTAYDNLASDIIERKLQKGTYDVLSNMYPITNCEMRWFILLTKETKPAEEKPVEEAKKEEKEPVKEKPVEETEKEEKEPVEEAKKEEKEPAKTEA